MKIGLHFSLGWGIPSKLISWFSAGPFSHVDCYWDDKTLLGARSDRIGGVPAGVWPRPQAYEKWRKTLVLELYATPAQYELWHHFIELQIAKPYDSSAIWGFAFERNWRNCDAWYCSELQAAALEAAGLCPKLVTPANKITPVTLATVVSALGGVTVT